MNACLFLCLDVYLCICMYIYIYITYIYIYTYTYMYMYMYRYMFMYIYIYLYIYIYINMYINIYINIFTNIYVNINIYIYKYIGIEHILWIKPWRPVMQGSASATHAPKKSKSSPEFLLNKPVFPNHLMSAHAAACTETLVQVPQDCKANRRQDCIPLGFFCCRRQADINV